MKRLSRDIKTILFYRKKARLLVEIVVLSVLFLVYAVLQLHTIRGDPRSFPDTEAYIQTSVQPLWSSSFLAGSRAFVIPLIYKLFGTNTLHIVIMQVVFSTLSWSILGVQLSKSVQILWLKPLVFACILLFSLTNPIIGWNTVLLSESMSLSFMALFIASYLSLVRSWHSLKGVFVVLVAFFLAFTRDTNAWVVVMIAGLTACTAMITGTWKKHGIIITALVIIFALNQVSFNRGERWVFSLQNVLTQRILPNQEYLGYFVNCGMPVTPALTRMAGQWAGSEDGALYKDPALDEYRTWLHALGKSCYTRWLLTYRSMTLTAPLTDLGSLIATRMEGYFAPDFAATLPAPLQKFIYPDKMALFLWWIGAIGIGIALGLQLWKENPAWIVAISMLLLVYPHAILVWHGDAMEVARHAVQVSVQFYLGIWLTILLISDLSIISIWKRFRK